ncbi:MAG: tetratricopeptide (TPR) repeat protein [Paraglaciecola sp.]|jgi:tetratricopeptide (TPR) repeat protein
MMKLHKQYQWYFILTVFMSLAGCTTTGGQTEQPELSEIIPESRSRVLEQATAAQRNNQYDKAIILYVKALGLEHQTEAKSEGYIAQGYSAQGYSVEESMAEKPITEQTMSDSQVVYNIGILEIKQGHIDLAKTAFSHVLSLDPNHGLAQTQLGIISLGQKDKVKALDLLTKAIDSDQLRLSNRQGNTLDVSQAYNGYVQLDKTSPLPAYTGIAVMHDLDGQHLKAIELFTLVKDIDRQDPLIYTNLGYSQYLSGNLIEAELNFKKAIDLRPKFKRAWLNLGLVYVRKGMYSKAFQTLKQVMPAAHAYNDIGYFLMLEGRDSEAEYFLQYAIELSPTYFVKANINLENVRLNLNRKIDVAYADENNKNKK